MGTQKIIHPLAIEKIGSELAVAWSDGAESFIPVEVLRRRCPCASCAGEPDVTGRVVPPKPVLGPGSFDLLAWQTVGGYAIQPRWGDGHMSGIFSYRLLRDLGSCG
jgi:DUF971 family protein